MYISFHNILPIAWVALAVALVSMIWLLTIYRSRITLHTPSSKNPKDRDSAGNTLTSEDSICAQLPPVSVIVYTCDNSRRLAEMLPKVIEQNYPGEFDIVVVNDGSSEAVNDVIKLMGAEHPNLHQTFVPLGAKNLSRKKLAISLGIKAARHPNLILTTAACIPASERWLALMARHFSRGKKVVLGAATIGGLKGSMRKFDEVASMTTWLSAAAKGHPYRGTGWNIGYTRELFFESKGFSDTLNLQNGDDDLFISRVATGENTAVELSPDALMTFGTRNPNEEARESKLQHTFTARLLPKGARRIMGASTLMLWLWIAAVTVMIVFTLPNLIGVAVAPILLAALWIPLTLAWKHTGAVLGVKLNPATLWWNMLWRWMVNLNARLKCDSADRANYTWQK